MTDTTPSDPFRAHRDAWTAAAQTCEDRLGTGPPRARTEVIYVDLGYHKTCAIELLVRRVEGRQEQKQVTSPSRRVEGRQVGGIIKGRCGWVEI